MQETLANRNALLEKFLAMQQQQQQVNQHCFMQSTA